MADRSRNIHPNRGLQHAFRHDQARRRPRRPPQLAAATGVSEGDWDKPFIAICNSHVDIIPGHVHLQAVGNYVKECVRAAGGVPFLFNTIGVDDGIAMGHNGMKYSLPSRELIADCVETMIEAHMFDGMICIPNCDKIVPGNVHGGDARQRADRLRLGRADGGGEERPAARRST